MTQLLPGEYSNLEKCVRLEKLRVPRAYRMIFMVKIFIGYRYIKTTFEEHQKWLDQYIQDMLSRIIPGSNGEQSGGRDNGQPFDGPASHPGRGAEGIPGRHRHRHGRCWEHREPVRAVGDGQLSIQQEHVHRQDRSEHDTTGQPDQRDHLQQWVAGML